MIGEFNGWNEGKHSMGAWSLWVFMRRLCGGKEVGCFINFNPCQRWAEALQSGSFANSSELRRGMHRIADIPNFRWGDSMDGKTGIAGCK